MIIYLLLLQIIKTELSKIGFSECETCDEKYLKFNELLSSDIFSDITHKIDNNMESTLQKVFENKDSLNENLETIFVKEILTDNDRIEKFGKYHISVIKSEPITKKIDEKYLIKKTQDILNNSDNIDCGHREAISYVGFYKYFYGDGNPNNGLVNRLKRCIIDLDAFNEKYKSLDEYQSQKIKLLMMIYLIEIDKCFSTKDWFDKTKASVNVVEMLEKATMENSDLSLIGVSTVNGRIMHELKKNVFLGIDYKIAFEIKNEVFKAVQGFMFWYDYINSLMFSFNDHPCNYFERIYNDVPDVSEFGDTSNMPDSHYDMSVLETFYFKLYLNEISGRLNDLITIYSEIIRLKFEKPSQQVLDMYEKAREQNIVIRKDNVSSIYDDSSLYKMLKVMVYGDERIEKYDKKKLNNTLKVVNNYFDYLEQEVRGYRNNITLVDCASLIRIYLFEKTLKIPNKFFRYTTSQSERSIHRELNRGSEAFEKNKTASFELVRWYTLKCMGEADSNIEYYFATMCKVDTLLKWMLECDNIHILRYKYKFVNNRLEEKMKIKVLPQLLF